MARPNYQFAKRQKDLEKKRKKEEKRQKKLERSRAAADGTAETEELEEGAEDFPEDGGDREDA